MMEEENEAVGKLIDVIIKNNPKIDISEPMEFTFKFKVRRISDKEILVTNPCLTVGWE